MRLVKYCCAERGRAGRDDPQSRILYMYWWYIARYGGSESPVQCAAADT